MRLTVVLLVVNFFNFFQLGIITYMIVSMSLKSG